MNKKSIWEDVEIAYRKQKKDFANYPEHVVAQAAVVSIKSGELLKKAESIKYKKQNNDLKEEAINVIVSAIIFLENQKTD